LITACIIQARLKSSRLPGKVMLPLPTGRLVIEEVVKRCRRIDGVDHVVAAISGDDDSDMIVSFARNAGATIVRGPEHDVLARYALAAKAVNADVVMRITADCPLIDAKVCEKVLEAHREHRGYVSNVRPRTWPHGYDCEVFDAALLHKADASAASAHEREHVTPWMYARPICLGPNVAAEANLAHIRLTLDTIEDYVTIWHEFERRRADDINRRYIEAIHATH